MKIYFHSKTTNKPLQKTVKQKNNLIVLIPENYLEATDPTTIKSSLKIKTTST